MTRETFGACRAVLRSSNSVVGRRSARLYWTNSVCVPGSSWSAIGAHHSASSMRDRYRTAGSAGRCRPYGPAHALYAAIGTGSTSIVEVAPPTALVASVIGPAPARPRPRRTCGISRKRGMSRRTVWALSRGTIGSIAAMTSRTGWPSMVSIRDPMRSRYGGSASTTTTSSTSSSLVKSQRRSGRLSTGYVPLPQM